MSDMPREVRLTHPPIVTSNGVFPDSKTVESVQYVRADIADEAIEALRAENAQMCVYIASFDGLAAAHKAALEKLRAEVERLEGEVARLRADAAPKELPKSEYVSRVIARLSLPLSAELAADVESLRKDAANIIYLDHLALRSMGSEIAALTEANQRLIAHLARVVDAKSKMDDGIMRTGNIQCNDYERLIDAIYAAATSVELVNMTKNSGDAP